MLLFVITWPFVRHPVTTCVELRISSSKELYDFGAGALLNVGFRISGSGFQISGTKFQVSGFKFQVRVSDFGFQVWVGLKGWRVRGVTILERVRSLSTPLTPFQTCG